MHTPIKLGGASSSDSADLTAVAADILNGKTAIFNGSGDEPGTGTMADKSGSVSSADASLDTTNSRFRLKVPSTGKYDTSAYLYSPYANVASLLGLTADKIKKGESILGITGTWEGYVATDTDLYINGAFGSLIGNNVSYGKYADYLFFKADTDCIVAQYIYNQDFYDAKPDKSHMSLTPKVGLKLGNGINAAPYKTLNVDYIFPYLPSTAAQRGITSGYHNSRIAIGVATGGVSINSDGTLSTSGQTKESSQYIALNYAKSDTKYTLTVDISSYSQTLYFYMWIFPGYRMRSEVFTANITNIYLE